MPQRKPQPSELTSWKEIAEYLGVTVRTAQNWERDRGLPVRRIPGERGRVFADPESLNRWKASSQAVPAPARMRGRAAIGLSVLAFSAVIFVYFSNRPGPPDRFRLEGTQVVVLDSHGRELWRHRFESAFAEGYRVEGILAQGLAWFGDLDGDARTEFLFTHRGEPQARYGSTVFCFSDRGKVKWKWTPGRRVATALGENFTPPFLTEQVRIVHGPRGPRVVVISHHVAEYPAQVAALSPNGAPAGEYWHSGHLNHADIADLDGDGSSELIVAGVDNGYKAAALLALDPERLAGASEEPDAEHQLAGFGAGAEKARIIFARTCINRLTEEYNRISVMGIAGGQIHVSTLERGPTELSFGVAYWLDYNFSVLKADFDDSLRALHRTMGQDGRLRHPFTEGEVEALREVKVLKALARGRRR